MTSLVYRRDIVLPAPSEDDRRADVERIKDGLNVYPLSIPLSVLRKIPSHLRRKSGEISCIIGRENNAPKLIDLSQGNSYSIALDLGTTNLVAILYDNISGRDILEMPSENPQIAFGSDILTRMHYAMSPRPEDIYRVLTKGINALISDMCRKAGGITQTDIHSLVIAGNTVMSHFFLGLDIGSIPVDPFVPVVKSPGFFRASELHVEINPEASVYVFPNAGSYVGGDIIAGILTSGIAESVEPCILIDVGTNAEVVIGNRDWMLVGAGAAGPALEEGVSLIGKRAGKGIIYDIKMDGTGTPCRTFDGASPEGICGSGMVSLLFELYKSGIIDKGGVLNQGQRGVTECRGEPAFEISCSNAGNSLYIRQSEINNFMKSKAALFTLLLVLTRTVGIEFRDVKKVYVSGALGTGIDVAKAFGIGMLPRWSPDRIMLLGNSSLRGAGMLLRDGELVERINAVTERITYKHMHDDPEFMKEFMGAVFIPHTNPDLLKV